MRISGKKACLWLVFAGFFCGIFALKAGAPPAWLYDLFCVPSAWIASLHTGGDFSLCEPAGARIITGTTCLMVGPECSGAAFFLTLSASVAWLTLRESSRWRVFLPLVLPGAWLVTIFLNACRIVCAWRARTMLPMDFALSPGLVHSLVGVSIFLAGLVFSMFLLVFIIKKTEGGDAGIFARDSGERVL